LAFFSFVGSACSTRHAGEIAAAPSEPLELPGAGTTTLPDFSSVSLATVAGHTTTTAPQIGGGKAKINGTVVGPDGPVPGATVRVERLIGKKEATSDTNTGPDGTWAFDSVQGGSYRLRAWRPPDLVTNEPAMFFLAAGEKRTIALSAAAVGAVQVTSALAPSPLPSVGLVNLAVAVTRSAIDADGLVHPAPLPGADLALSLSGSLSLGSAGHQLTDQTGTARWQLYCVGPGLNTLSVTLSNTDTRALTAPACGQFLLPSPPQSGGG